MAKKVVIIGAGVGGIACAARLSKAGFDVTVIEKNNFAGGRCSLMYNAGHRFDTGPSLLLLPILFHQTFADLGTTLEKEGVELLKCEPNYQLFFHDGQFTLSSDLSTMHKHITELEPFDGYLSFLGEAGKHYSLSLEHVLNKNFGSFLNMARPSFLRHVLTLHPFESIWSRACRHFKTDRLRRAFTFASMYMGMSPFEAPGTYSLLQYTECVEGIWYPRGGFYRLLEVLLNMSKRNGAKYLLETNVNRIVTDSGKVTGVEISTGTETPEILSADIVICNADLVYAYNNLLPPTKHAERLANRKQSCSSVSFYWSIKTKVPALQIHNIFLAEAYQESFDDIFHGVGIPSEPSFYVNVPSHVDPSAAPDGKDSIIVLVPISSKGSVDVDKLRKHILSVIHKRTGTDLAPLIYHEIVNTPQEWESKFNLHQGSILGLSHSFFNVLSFRPRIRHDKYQGLYFVGASTHPGTGVPVVLAGSGLTVKEIMNDLNGNSIRYQWYLLSAALVLAILALVLPLLS
ncbi:phytoene desaturase [Microthyrium microscopicum]|uniref:Phytoene desaturase n=1 Tax=Microthyrium microscopicum TaxID=703497 RepID=A0A6A6UFH7_9PEZI|nr:phytoene desaturase [Microthyrium microscopicum]